MKEQHQVRSQTKVVIGVAAIVAASAFACSAPPPPERQESTSQFITGLSTCSHPICATGIALLTTCDPCATQLCAQDPYCCSSAWDATCVGEVTSICGQSCTPTPPPPPTGNTCAHGLCQTGIALASTCSACATQLCTQDPYCCLAAWDATCVGEVTSICGQSCN